MNFNKLKSHLKAVVLGIINSRITAEDEQFIRQNLNKQEQILFYRMTQFDQRHALNVAYTIRDLVGRRTKIKIEKLYAAALLHDVGKVWLKLSLKDRVIQTLWFVFFKPLAEFLAERGGREEASRLSKLMYVKKYHPKIGAELAVEIGVEPGIVYLIEHHEDPIMPDEPKELTILREADELN